MIILKILLIILLAVLGIILLLLVLPIAAEASFIDKKLKYEVSFAWIPVINSEGGGLVGWFQRRRKKADLNDDDDEPPLSEPADEVTVNTEPDYDDTSPQSAENEPEDNAPDNSEPPAEEEVQSAEQHDIPDDKNDSEEKSEGKGDEKKTLGDKVGTILDIWSCAKNPAAKIFRGIHLEDIYIDFIIADTDAYKCALNYGRISAAVYNGLALLSRIFTVRFKTVDVRCGFGIEKSQWDGALRVRFCLGTAVLSGIWFIGAYVFRVLIPGKIKRKKAKASAAQQN